MAKACFKCGVTKPLTEFYRHPQMADGRLGKCKECNKRDVQLNYKLRRAQYSAYDQDRYQDPLRRFLTRVYAKNHRDRNPEKAKARQQANNAVRDGKLEKQPCIHCGNEKVQAHHKDYSKPLDVTWMCFRCHREKGHGQVVTVQEV